MNEKSIATEALKALAIRMAVNTRPYNVKGSTPDAPALCRRCLCMGWHIAYCTEERVEVPQRQNVDRLQ